MNRVLVTGGCGFIGSHLSLLLIENNFDVTIVDSNQNSSSNVIGKIEYLAKLKNIYRKKITFFKGDIRDEKFIKNVFENEYSKSRSFDCVFHLAGLKSIKESYQSPLEYWETNVLGTINLLKAMENAEKKVQAKVNEKKQKGIKVVSEKDW